MSYSRRELYALGEPLGESVTQRKLGGGYVCGGGGGGGGSSAPTTTTTYQSNIPEYARPYVENMLGAAQKQIYTMDSSGTPTGFTPYQPYSTDPTKYVAGFSPMQQQAFETAANLQVPGQYATAEGLAGATALGSMGLAGQMAGAGQRYARQATTPSSVQAYMSPYMQNVVDYQKSQAARDYMIQNQARQAQAVGAGAFGGSRQAIVQSEADRALQSQLQGITATGAQQAFQNAQQAQQYAANLGLQGQQAALGGLGQTLQGAQTIGQLGTSALGAQTNIANLQQQYGAQQQAQQQQIINQAIQNYATAQQYPYMQLGILNSLLRGLPMQATTTASYQATPSTAQQVAGLGLSGLGAYKALSGMKEGGVVKGLAAGGTGGREMTGGVEGALQAKLKMMDDAELQQVIATTQSPRLKAMAQEVLAEHQIREQAELQAQQAIARDQAPKPQIPSAGLAAAPAPVMDSMNMAGGGIVAFADGGDAEDEDPFAGISPEDQKLIRQQQAFARAAGVDPNAFAGYKASLEEQRKGLGQAKDYAMGMGLMDVGARIASTPGPWGYGIAQSIQGALPGFQKNVADYQRQKADLAKAEFEVAREEQKDAQGRANTYEKAVENRDRLANEMKRTEMQVAGGIQQARISATRETDFKDLSNKFYQERIAKGEPEGANTQAAAARDAANALRGTETRLGQQQTQVETTALKEDKTLQDLYKKRNMLSITPKQAEKNRDAITAIEDDIAAQEARVLARARRQPQQTAQPTAAPTGGETGYNPNQFKIVGQS